MHHLQGTYPSGCCSLQGSGHPQVACQQKSTAAGQVEFLQNNSGVRTSSQPPEPHKADRTDKELRQYLPYLEFWLSHYQWYRLTPPVPTPLMTQRCFLDSTSNFSPPSLRLCETGGAPTCTRHRRIRAIPPK